MQKPVFVYILSSRWRTTYVGITDDLIARVKEHKLGACAFTRKYNIDRLVWFEAQPDRRSAAAREKQIKGWRRSKKVELINSANPDWNDLSIAGFAILLRLE